MVTTLKTAIFSAAALALVCAPSNLWAQSSPGDRAADRIAAAVKLVESACAADIGKFCANVTKGEGRVITCMQAHDDQLSRSCQLSLYRASRNLDQALSRVERIADACMDDIEAQCGNAERIGQCVMDKAASLSPSCQKIVAGIRQIGQGLETRGAR
jgi:hypothetical protein